MHGMSGFQKAVAPIQFEFQTNKALTWRSFVGFIQEGCLIALVCEGSGRVPRGIG